MPKRLLTGPPPHSPKLEMLIPLAHPTSPRRLSATRPAPPVRNDRFDGHEPVRTRNRRLVRDVNDRQAGIIRWGDQQRARRRRPAERPLQPKYLGTAISLSQSKIPRREPTSETSPRASSLPRLTRPHLHRSPRSPHSRILLPGPCPRHPPNLHLPPRHADPGHAVYDACS